MKILEKLVEDDIIVITADHGNDPTIGHSQHTRENVPLLIYNKKLKDKYINIGLRNTMSDTAATILEYFKIEEKLEHGKSYLSLLK